MLSKYSIEKLKTADSVLLSLLMRYMNNGINRVLAPNSLMSVTYSTYSFVKVRKESITCPWLPQYLLYKLPPILKTCKHNDNVPV